MKKIRAKLIGAISVALMLASGLVAFLPSTDVSAKEIDIRTSEYGYGKYTVNVRGIGYDGVYDEDSVTFWYLPVYATITEDEDTGKQYIELDYEADDGTEESDGEVAKIVVNVYDEDGNLVKELSPMTILPPTMKAEISFAGTNLPSGTYTVQVSAYDKDGNLIYKPYEFQFEYEAIAVPDTGGLFQNLNISKEDYLITGLLIFFVFGIVGLGIVMRSDKARKRK